MQVVGVYIDVFEDRFLVLTGVHQYVGTQVPLSKTIAEAVHKLGEMFDDYDSLRARGYTNWLKSAPTDVWADFDAGIPAHRMPLGKSRIGDIRLSPALYESLNGRN